MAQFWLKPYMILHLLFALGLVLMVVSFLIDNVKQIPGVQKLFFNKYHLAMRAYLLLENQKALQPSHEGFKVIEKILQAEARKKSCSDQFTLTSLEPKGADLSFGTKRATESRAIKVTVSYKDSSPHHTDWNLESFRHAFENRYGHISLSLIPDQYEKLEALY